MVLNPTRIHISMALAAALVPFAAGSACAPEAETAPARQGDALARIDLATPRRVATYDWKPFQWIGDVSADGRRLIVSHNDNGQLALVSLDGGAVRWLTDPTREWDPTWVLESRLSPDGRRAAFHQFDNEDTWTAWVTDLEGSTQRPLWRPPGSVYHPPLAWHPDGRHLLLEAGTDGRQWLVEYDVDGDRHLRLVSNVASGSARYTPDGSWIAYRAETEGGDENRLIRRDGERDVTFEGLPRGAELVGFSPGGDHVLYRADWQGAPALFRKRFQHPAAVGDPVVVQTDRWRMNDIGLDGRGRLFYSVNTSRRETWTAPLGVDGRISVGATTALWGDFAHRPSYSPEGSRIAFFRNVSARGAGDRRLVVASLADGTAFEPTVPVPVGYPAWVRWMPDGRSLVLKVIDDRARYAFYRYHLESAAVDTLQLWNGSPVVGMLDVTRDGRGVVFAIRPEAPEMPEQPWELRYLDVGTGQERVVARSADRINMPAVSPSGDSVAVVVGGSVAMAPLSGGALRTIHRDSTITFRHTLDWAPDGRFLYLRQGDERYEEYDRVIRLDVRTGQVTDMEFDTGGVDVLVHGVAVNPAGDQLAVVAERKGREEVWVLEGIFPTSEGDASGPTAGRPAALR
ncbi:MAG: hypothetical protein RH859_10410 [Longimicrobiales bacterium]